MRASTSVNAGSMADIAFLMLIFFLTTTTIATDKGLDQTLPQPCEQGDCSSEIAERNIFQISVNGDGDYLIQNQKMQLSELKQKLIEFIENTDNLESMPASPQKVYVNLDISRSLNYTNYVQVLDEVKAAYSILRENYSKLKFDKTYIQLSALETQHVLKAYPFQLAESTGIAEINQE
ncbi:ExbD/TolR family protein [Leeuwenhoekiella marinoflava]|uniref:Biopolymer transport protein ExbD n=2 Tax=Leeuwenhoekiella marinoflava TaxID=988 RepID=A0A4Q0PPV5_9FLAO|nr:biopolymer transporter ExbD [Leeuwenhoekiella marinoflava]RXG32523.1 biopolymer transport protein ExbD [Leeuwenhoekiella marinoflava]SHE68581.1 Biopolymer transport protein ExbD [Leeuwenhoekiella marinoflava DSM 3653]